MRPGPVGRLRGDEGGFVLVFFALALPVLIGLVGLAIDGSRLFALDSQLAAQADAAALAGASELDRSAAAIVNARRAASALRNGAEAADGDGGGLGFRFAATLDDLRRSRDYTLSDTAGESARFIEVATSSRSLAASFLQAVGIAVPPLRRAAIAESRYQACDVTPVLVCHRDPQAFFATAFRGRQYLLRYGDGVRGDGTLALLDQAGDAAGRRSLVGLASDSPALCHTDRLLARGNVAAIEIDAAINVRFDRYVDPRGPIAPDLAAFPPAPNVIQGRRLQACASNPRGGDIDPPYRLPRDAAFRNLRGNPPYDLGTGDWKVSAPLGGSGLPPSSTALAEYVGWNHADKSPIFQGTLLTAPSRYDLYLRELGLSEATQATQVLTRDSLAAVATMPTGGPRSFPFNLRAESPAPRCYAGGRPPTDPRRRVLYAAVADCGAPLDGDRMSGAVAKLFVTEPAEGGQLLVEFVSRVRPRDDEGKLRHIVRLVEVE